MAVETKPDILTTWTCLSDKATHLAYYLATSHASGILVDDEVLAAYMGLEPSKLDKIAAELTSFDLLSSTTYKEELQKAARGERTIFSNNTGMQWTPTQAQKILDCTGSASFLSRSHYYVPPEKAEAIIHAFVETATELAPELKPELQ